MPKFPKPKPLPEPRKPGPKPKPKPKPRQPIYELALLAVMVLLLTSCEKTRYKYFPTAPDTVVVADTVYVPCLPPWIKCPKRK